MDLIPFLSFTVVFCCLVILVSAQGDRIGRFVPVALIVVEVLLVLLDRGILSTPVGNLSTARSVLSTVAAIGAMVQFLRQGDRALTLLAAFAGLQQFLVSLGVIEP